MRPETNMTDTNQASDDTDTSPRLRLRHRCTVDLRHPSSAPHPHGTTPRAGEKERAPNEHAPAATQSPAIAPGNWPPIRVRPPAALFSRGQAQPTHRRPPNGQQSASKRENF